MRHSTSSRRTRALSKPAPTIVCNSLCAKCLRQCKQPTAAVLVDCPRFHPRPFKITEHRFDQLELFGKK
jgi:hypothetical protein